MIRRRDRRLLTHAATGRISDPLATPTGLEPATSAVTGRRANQLRHGAMHRNGCLALRTPSGIRTRATALKGGVPEPLDDGGLADLDVPVRATPA